MPADGHDKPSKPKAVAQIALGADKDKRPTIRVLMSDGRVTEFAERVIVIPENPRDQEDTRVFGLLVNGRGEPYVDVNGDYVLLRVPPLTMHRQSQPDDLLSYADVARAAGVHPSTIKRAVRAGELAKPTKIGARGRRFRLDDVKAWLAQNDKPRH
jgi:excisionase family DNA binding protein